MTNEAGRSTNISELAKQETTPRSEKGKVTERDGGVQPGSASTTGPLAKVQTFLMSLDWATLASVAAAAFAGQKLPLDQVIARAPWAFQFGNVPVRSIIVAVIFGLIHAFLLR